MSIRLLGRVRVKERDVLFALGGRLQRDEVRCLFLGVDPHHIDEAQASRTAGPIARRGTLKVIGRDCLSIARTFSLAHIRQEPIYCFPCCSAARAFLIPPGNHGSSTLCMTGAPSLQRPMFFRAIVPDFDFALVLVGLCEVIGKLHPQPRFFRAAECLSEADRHFRADTGLAINHVVERLAGDAKNLCPGGHGQSERLKAIPDASCAAHALTIFSLAIVFPSFHYNRELHDLRGVTRELLVRCEIALEIT